MILLILKAVGTQGHSLSEEENFLLVDGRLTVPWRSRKLLVRTYLSMRAGPTWLYFVVLTKITQLNV